MVKWKSTPHPPNFNVVVFSRAEDPLALRANELVFEVMVGARVRFVVNLEIGGKGVVGFELGIGGKGVGAWGSRLARTPQEDPWGND